MIYMQKILFFIVTVLLTANIYASNPNVLIIYADDMGYGDVSYGDKTCKIQTPTIDALADSGMTFIDGHSSSGLCSSSRYAILTGQYHWRRFHGIVYSWENSIFKPEEFTVARMFKERGYKTACIGKWHLGWNWKSIIKEGVKPRAKDQKGDNRFKVMYATEDFNWDKKIEGGVTAQGFDYYFGDDSINFPPYTWIENDIAITPPTKMFSKEDHDNCKEATDFFRAGPQSDDWTMQEVLPTITKKAIEYINKQSKDEPFFLYLALSSPHAPVLPNDEFKNTSKAGLYGDFIQQTDADIAKILNALEEKGLRENTLIVFTSDNGAEGKYAIERKKNFGHKSSGVFRGYKRDIFEGGHHVPFIVSWQGKIPAGKKSEALINQVDLVASFAEIISYNLSKDQAKDSFSMLPVFLGEKDSIREECIHNTNPNKFALRQGDWVLLNNPTKAKDKNAFLLYNLKDDISQENNIFEKHPEKAMQMQERLKELVKSNSTAPHCM